MNDLFEIITSLKISTFNGCINVNNHESFVLLSEKFYKYFIIITYLRRTCNEELIRGDLFYTASSYFFYLKNNCTI